MTTRPGDILPAHDLTALYLMTDSQDIRATLTTLSDPELEAAGVARAHVTALLTDADQGEVWAAETRRPYDAATSYTRVR